MTIQLYPASRERSTASLPETVKCQASRTCFPDGPRSTFYGRGRCYHSKIWGDIHHMGETWFCQKAGCILYVLHVNAVNYTVNDEKSLDFWDTLFLHKPVTGEHPPQSPSPKSRSRNAKWCQPQYLFHRKMFQWRQELRVNHRTTYSTFTCIALYTSIYIHTDSLNPNIIYFAECTKYKVSIGYKSYI